MTPAAGPDRVDVFLDEWREARPGLDVSALALTIRVLRAARLLQARLDRLAAAHGLSHKGDLDVLTALLRASHALTPTDLADALLLTTGGMTTRLDRLEQSGMIVREPNPDDGRGLLVSLTQRGRRTADVAFADLLGAQSSLAGRVRAADSAGAMNALRALLVELGDTPTTARTR